MSDLLSDKKNLTLLKHICFGKGVSVNYSQLSRLLKKHRNTIKKRVVALMKKEIIDRPIFPFIGLLKEYPLLVIARADLPHTEEIKKWMTLDENIFGAFRIREEEYNIMLFEFHRSLYDQYCWRESLVKQGAIPSRDARFPSSTLFFSNNLLAKYHPNEGIKLIEEEFKKKGEFKIGDFKLDELDIEILKNLLEGRGVKVNENLLSREVGLNRKTIQRRISKLKKEGVILNPLCRFPNFFVPPCFIFVVSLVELKKHQKEILKQWINDPHLSCIYKTSTGRYNFLLLGNYLSIEEHLKWEEDYALMYPGCFGQASINYLTPRMTVSIDQQKVSLGIINKRLKKLKKPKE